MMEAYDYEAERKYMERAARERKMEDDGAPEGAACMVCVLLVSAAIVASLLYVAFVYMW